MVLTLSAKVLDIIFLRGKWNGFETTSTSSAWNLLKHCRIIHWNIRVCASQIPYKSFIVFCRYAKECAARHTYANPLWFFFLIFWSFTYKAADITNHRSQFHLLTEKLESTICLCRWVHIQTDQKPQSNFILRNGLQNNFQPLFRMIVIMEAQASMIISHQEESKQNTSSKHTIYNVTIKKILTFKARLEITKSAGSDASRTEN